MHTLVNDAAILQVLFDGLSYVSRLIRAEMDCRSLVLQLRTRHCQTLLNM